MPDTPPLPESLSALDEDAYCPNCGYNQRGLPGDPIRCPECGGQFQRRELRRPKQPRVMSRLERIRRDPKAAADLCAMATIPGLLAVLALLLTGSEIRRLAEPVASASGIIWLIGFALFAHRCRGLPRWGTALAKYHLWGSAAMAVNLVLVGVGWGLLGALCMFGVEGMMIRVIEGPASASSIGLAIVASLVLGLALLPGLLVAALVVRFDPMGWLKRLGADALDGLVQRLAEQAPESDERAEQRAGANSALR